MAKTKLLAKNSSESARENIQKQLAKVTNRVRNLDKKGKSAFDYVNDKTLSLKKKLSGLHFFSWLFQKHTKTGRFGKKTVADRDDAVKAIDNNQDVTPDFFNPFAAINADDANTQPATLKGAFAARVQEEMDLTQANDFERGKISDEEREFMVMQILYGSQAFTTNQEKLENQYVAEHDAVSDYQTDSGQVDTDTPDTFELALSVMKPPDLYLDYTIARTEEKKRKLGGKIDERALIIRLLSTDETFQNLVDRERWSNPNYDPLKDDDKHSLVNKMIKRTRASMQEVGHSFVRLITRKEGKELNSYSFGFWPVGVSFIGGVTEGRVRNPDPDRYDSRNIAVHYPIRYSDYLRSAARIRGIRGTRRSYSFTGYNCTSFAVEVAQAAGISIADRDSSADITTMMSKSHRVEMPAALRRFVEREMQAQAQSRNVLIEKLNAVPLFNQLYDGWEEGIPQYIPELFLDALQQTVSGTPSATLRGVAGFQYNEGQGNVRNQFIDFALSGDAGLTAAMGLGIRIPEFTNFRYQLLLTNLDRWDNDLLLNIENNRVFFRRTEHLRDEQRLRQLYIVKEAILGYVQLKVNDIQNNFPTENNITSVEQAMAIKDRVAQRRARFKEELGTVNVLQYIMDMAASQRHMTNILDSIANGTAVAPERIEELPQPDPAAVAAERERVLREHLQAALEPLNDSCTAEMAALNRRIMAIKPDAPTVDESHTGMLRVMLALAKANETIEGILNGGIGGEPALIWRDIMMIMEEYVPKIPQNELIEIISNM